MGTPSITRKAYVRATPNWLGSPVTHPKLTIPGGIRIDASQFAVVPAKDNRKYIEGGTFLGRTLAERDAGTGFGPAVDTDAEFCILFVDLQDAATDDITAGLQPKVGTVIYENLCPGFTALSALIKAKFRDNFHCLTFIA